MKVKQHIEGWIAIDSDNLTIQEEKGSWSGSEVLANIISDNYYKENSNKTETQLSHNGAYDEEMGGESLYIPNCNLSFYISDNKISLEEVEKRQLTQLIGGIDIYGENYGYSMWTIEGFEVQELSIGGHDLDSTLRTYKDKYIHILIEYDIKEGDS